MANMILTKTHGQRLSPAAQLLTDIQKAALLPQVIFTVFMQQTTTVSEVLYQMKFSLQPQASP